MSSKANRALRCPLGFSTVMVRSTSFPPYSIGIQPAGFAIGQLEYSQLDSLLAAGNGCLGSRVEHTICFPVSFGRIHQTPWSRISVDSVNPVEPSRRKRPSAI